MEMRVTSSAFHCFLLKGKKWQCLLRKSPENNAIPTANQVTAQSSCSVPTHVVALFLVCLLVTAGEEARKWGVLSQCCPTK